MKRRAKQLTWEQIDRLADALAHDLMMAQVDMTPLMLLLHEIAQHPFDASYAETIANQMTMRLFALTPEADTAFRAHVDAARLKLKGGTP